MKPLPFKMRQETEMEKYRAETFWTKEPETISWLSSFSPTDVFFDVGANVGVYSLYAASLYPDMGIVAFEPHPENYKSLWLNIKANHYPHIYAFRYAVGLRPGEVKFYSDDTKSGSSGGQVAPFGLETVMISIDDYNFKPTNIKIDIDGQELAVIQGMTSTLPHVKSILVEVSKASKQPIMDILIAAGFTTGNRFNKMSPHSRERREREGIDAENIVFTR